MWRWADVVPEHDELLRDLLHRVQQPGAAISPGHALDSTSGADGRRHVADHTAARWEGVPLTADNADADEGGTIFSDAAKDDAPAAKQPTTCVGRLFKVCKILVPHAILISMLITYLSVGALILTRFESRRELAGRSSKMRRLLLLYDSLSDESWRLHNALPNCSAERWKAESHRLFRDVSQLHEGDAFVFETEASNNKTTKWTFPTALLYALTVLTTCGYGEVDVMTDEGKIFAVTFALIGIPLMFITAADIGKFLSETFLRSVYQAERGWRWLQWRCCRRGERPRSRAGTSVAGSSDQVEEKLWFPIGAYISLICIYCSFGAVMFQYYEAAWSFVHAFHFGFNLIVTVGLGDLVVEDPVFLCLIVAYVIIGLSVVTMCVDLASTHLKAYFTRIHYFGRARRFLGMSEELRDMMRLLAAMRKKKGGGEVTWDDVKDFLAAELAQRAFEPNDAHKLRFIDETSSAVSTMRHNSCASDLLSHDKRLSALLRASTDGSEPSYL